MEEFMIARKLALSAAISVALAFASMASADEGHSHDSDSHNADVGTGEIAALVNEKPISNLLATRVSQQLAAQGQSPKRAAIVEELVNLEVLTQEAEKLKLDQEEEVATALHLQYTQTMANAYLAQISKDIEISEEEIRAEYDKQVAKLKADEYKASHILLDSEEDAKAVIAELNDGGDFAELAKTRSTGPTGESGGDLGWFLPENMVPEFSSAVATLDVGSYTTEAVQTEFGWHVIQLTEMRKAAKPDYSPSVKAGIENALVRQALTLRVNELREAATIEIK